jgi:hypothetical protein
MIAARFATLAHGQHAGRERKSTISSVADAAALVNVGDRAVKDARTVIAHATPEVITKVERGEVSVSRAAKVTTP